MLIKYKIHELSKDFEVSSKDIIALLKDRLGVEKKSQTSLEDSELNFIFDYLTRQHEVKSFDEYFAAGKVARDKRAEEKKAEKNRKLAEQMAILEQFKAAQAAQKAKASAKQEPKEAPKDGAKPESKTAPKPAERAAKSATKAETKVEAKSETKASAKAETKAEIKPVKQPKAGAKTETAAEPKVQREPVNIPPRPKKEKKGEAPNRGPVEIRKVDTRASNINIDKYNERYENIAPANSMKDNHQRKQKIKQKSQDYRRPQSAKRETEADKLRRIQLEKIKKTPITVTIGDEMTVAELAAAMKKTAAEVI